MRLTLTRSIYTVGISIMALGSICWIRLGVVKPRASVSVQRLAVRAAPPTMAPLTVSTQVGQVEGVADAGTIAFKGIPYATAPVGVLRWRAPQLPQPWQSVRQANAFGPACVQPALTVPIEGLRSVGPQSEDCLYLNLWTPETQTAAKRPVMVWIHGGAFVVGGSNLPLWNGAALASKGAVVVNFNHRLGQLGFFAHPALDQENPGGPANFGLLDQMAALKWVQQNIAAFGGDPSNVTIVGESAGAQSVLALMASPLAKGLFQKSIAQSIYLAPEMSREKAIGMGKRIADAVGLSQTGATSADLRAIPADKFRQLNIRKFSASPVLISGDAVLPKPVLSVFENGQQAQVPLIIGSTSNEASVATAFGIDVAALVQRLGPLRTLVRIFYPGVRSDNALGLQLIRDAVFTEPARRIAALHSRSAPAWRYYFSYVPSGLQSRWVDGVPHGGEIPFVMNTVQLNKAIVGNLTKADLDVAQQVSNRWFEFARSGVPTPSASPVWPPYSADSDKTMEFSESAFVRTDFMKARLDALSALSAQIFNAQRDLHTPAKERRP